MWNPSSKIPPAETIVWSPERDWFTEMVSTPRQIWDLRNRHRKITASVNVGLFFITMAALKFYRKGSYRPELELKETMVKKKKNKSEVSKRVQGLATICSTAASVFHFEISLSLD